MKSTSEYIQTYQNLKSNFAIDNGFAKYGGYEINNNVIEGEPLKKVKITYVHTLGKYGRKKVSKITKQALMQTESKIPLDNFSNVFFFKGDESVIVQNKRLREFFEKNTKIYIVEIHPNFSDKELDKVITDLGAKDFQSIAYPILPKQERAATVARNKSEFCMHIMGRDRHVYTTLVDNTEKWLYIPIGKSGWDTTYNDEQLFELNKHLQLEHGLRICGLSSRAIGMVSGDKNYSPLKEWMDKFKPGVKEMNYAKGMKEKNRSEVDLMIDAKGIKDKQLADIAKEYRANSNSMKCVPEALLAKINDTQELKDFCARDGEIADLIKTTYPLLRELKYSYSGMKQEIVFYLNAKFEQK